MNTRNQFAILRRKAGYTQSDVATKICVDQSAVAKWETGVAYPKADKLRVLADIYGCTVDQLLDMENAKAGA